MKKKLTYKYLLIFFIFSMFGCEDKKNEEEKKENSSEYVGVWILKTFDYANANCSGSLTESNTLLTGETSYNLKADGTYLQTDGFFCRDPESNEMCSGTWYNGASTLTIVSLMIPITYDITKDNETVLISNQKGTRSDGLNPTPREFCTKYQLTKK